MKIYYALWHIKTRKYEPTIFNSIDEEFIREFLINSVDIKKCKNIDFEELSTKELSCLTGYMFEESYSKFKQLDDNLPIDTKFDI